MPTPPGTLIGGRPYRTSLIILEPQNVIHLLWRCFVLFCWRCRWAFPRASRRASQDLSQGPSRPSGSQTRPQRAEKQGLIRRLESTSNLIKQRESYDRRVCQASLRFARGVLQVHFRMGSPASQPQKLTTDSQPVKL